MNDTRFKFRFWDLTEKRFVGDPEINKDGRVSCMDGIAGSDTCYDVIISQWTGMKDVGGNDIYEGDIVQNQAGRTFIIEYLHKGFEYREIIKGVKQSLFCTSIGDENLCRVIGNIYQNLEPIK